MSRIAVPFRRRGTHSGFEPSTLAELAWQRTHAAVSRWGWVGAALGALTALVAFAPAAWLARSVAANTGERLLLTDARGTVWSGSALAVLTGGPGSRDAAALPSRLHWSLKWRGLRLEVRLRQACCLNDEVVMQVRQRLSRVEVSVAPPASGGTLGRWPASWLAGLGTPWNTLQLGGTLQLATPGFTLESANGRWRLNGLAHLDVLAASSRLSTLPTLGSYRITLQGGDATTIVLDTIEGPLQLSGSGQWSGGHVRFRGEARAAPDSEAALNNLLNIIGRRQGALANISIG
jgi:general secretion pathway protein N